MTNLEDSSPQKLGAALRTAAFHSPSPSPEPNQARRTQSAFQMGFESHLLQGEQIPKLSVSKEGIIVTEMELKNKPTPLNMYQPSGIFDESPQRDGQTDSEERANSGIVKEEKSVGCSWPTHLKACPQNLSVSPKVVCIAEQEVRLQQFQNKHISILDGSKDLLVPFKPLSFGQFPRLDGACLPLLPCSKMQTKAELIEQRKEARRKRNLLRMSREEGMVEPAFEQVLGSTVDHLLRVTLTLLLNKALREKKKKALYGASASTIKLENTRIDSPAQLLARQESNRVQSRDAEAPIDQKDHIFLQSDHVSVLEEENPNFCNDLGTQRQQSFKTTRENEFQTIDKPVPPTLGDDPFGKSEIARKTGDLSQGVPVEGGDQQDFSSRERGAEEKEFEAKLFQSNNKKSSIPNRRYLTTKGVNTSEEIQVEAPVMPMSSKFFKKDHCQSPDTLKKKVGLKKKITNKKSSPKKRKRTTSKGRSESNMRSKDLQHHAPKIKRKRITCRDKDEDKNVNISSQLSNQTKRVQLSSKQTLGETWRKEGAATQSNLSKMYILAHSNDNFENENQMSVSINVNNGRKETSKTLMSHPDFEDSKGRVTPSETRYSKIMIMSPPKKKDGIVDKPACPLPIVDFQNSDILAANKIEEGLSTGEAYPIPSPQSATKQNLRFESFISPEEPRSLTKQQRKRKDRLMTYEATHLNSLLASNSHLHTGPSQLTTKYPESKLTKLKTTTNDNFQRMYPTIYKKQLAEKQLGFVRGFNSKYSNLSNMPFVQRSYNSKEKLLQNCDTHDAIEEISDNIFSTAGKTSRRPKSTKVGRNNIKKNVWMGHQLDIVVSSKSPFTGSSKELEIGFEPGEGMGSVDNQMRLTQGSTQNLTKGDPFMMSQVRPTTSHISKKALDDNARFIANSSFRMTTKSNVNKQIIGIAHPYLQIDKSKIFQSEASQNKRGLLLEKKKKKSPFMSSRQLARQLSPKFQSNSYFQAKQDFMGKFFALRDQFAAENKSTNFRTLNVGPSATSRPARAATAQRQTSDEGGSLPQSGEKIVYAVSPPYINQEAGKHSVDYNSQPLTTKSSVKEHRRRRRYVPKGHSQVWQQAYPKLHGPL